MKILLLILIYLLQTITSDPIKYPGLRFGISNEALKKIQSKVIPAYLNSKPIPLPPIHVSQHIDFIGTVVIDITDNKLVFDTIKEDQFNITMSQKDTPVLDVGIYNLTGFSEFKYDFKSGFYNSTGNGTFTIESVSITLNTKVFGLPNAIETDKNGIGVQINDIKLNSIDFDVAFSGQGNLERLLKFVILNIKNSFVDILKSMISNEKVPEINKSLNETLSHANLSVSLGDGLILDYSLFSEPTVVDQQIMDLSLNASIRASDVDFSESAMPIPDITSTSKEVDLYVNQYIFDSFFYTAYKKGALDIVIPSEKAPLGILNTNYLSGIIPKLKDLYGLDRKIDLGLTCLEKPTFNFMENYTDLSLSYNISSIVRLDDRNETFLTIKSDLRTNLTFSVGGGYINMSIYEFNLENFTIVQQTDIGQLDVNALKDKFNAIAGYLKGYINTFFQKWGLRIPDMYGINFNDTIIDIKEGFALMEMDIQLNRIFNYLNLLE
jgi:hypothetical protein